MEETKDALSEAIAEASLRKLRDRSIKVSAAKNKEKATQITFFRWVENNKENFPALDKIYAIPNGEKRDAMTGAVLKSMGVRAGVWDVFCPCTNDVETWPGLYIEFKAPGLEGKNESGLTKEQVEFREKNPMYDYALFDTWEEAADYVTTFYKLEDNRGVC